MFASCLIKPAGDACRAAFAGGYAGEQAARHGGDQPTPTAVVAIGLAQCLIGLLAQGLGEFWTALMLILCREYQATIFQQSLIALLEVWLEQGAAHLVFHDVDDIFPLALSAVELGSRDGVLAVVVDDDTRLAAHVGDMRLSEQEPESQFPVIPSWQIDVPSVGRGKELPPDGITLGGKLGMQDVIGEQVTLVERGLSLASIGEDEFGFGADEVQRAAFFLGLLDYSMRKLLIPQNNTN